MPKLYCYVDETGQDTQGAFFLVALVLVGQEREALRRQLRSIERRSGKTTHKWTRATLKQKQAYLAELVATDAFRGKILYRGFSQTTDYLACLIEAIAQGISRKARTSYKATVFIDGLGRGERHRVGAGLRRGGPDREGPGPEGRAGRVHPPGGCDSGLCRDAQEGKAYAQPLYRRALRAGWLEPL